jgi:hypothetical protein
MIHRCYYLFLFFPRQQLNHIAKMKKIFGESRKLCMYFYGQIFINEATDHKADQCWSSSYD